MSYVKMQDFLIKYFFLIRIMYPFYYLEVCFSAMLSHLSLHSIRKSAVIKH